MQRGQPHITGAMRSCLSHFNVSLSCVQNINRKKILQKKKKKTFGVKTLKIKIKSNKSKTSLTQVRRDKNNPNSPT